MNSRRVLPAVALVVAATVVSVVPAAARDHMGAAAAATGSRTPPLVLSVRDGASANYSTFRIKLPANAANKQVFVFLGRRVWWNCPKDRSALTHGGCANQKTILETAESGTPYRVRSDGTISIPVRYDLCKRPPRTRYPDGIFLTELMVKYPPGYDTFYASAFSHNAPGIGDLNVPFWNYTYGTLYPYPRGRTICVQ